MRRLLAWLASFREAFRLARAIQRGELLAVSRTLAPIPAPEPPPPRLTDRTPAFEAVGDGSSPSAVIAPPEESPNADPQGRYEVRTRRGDRTALKVRTDDLALAKRVFAQSYTTTVELYDHRLGLVRGSR